MTIRRTMTKTKTTCNIIKRPVDTIVVIARTRMLTTTKAKGVGGLLEEEFYEILTFCQNSDISAPHPSLPITLYKHDVLSL
jgi:hypothetical protein